MQFPKRARMGDFCLSIKIYKEENPYEIMQKYQIATSLVRNKDKGR